jgi:hypothetical protein
MIDLESVSKHLRKKNGAPNGKQFILNGLNKQTNENDINNIDTIASEPSSSISNSYTSYSEEQNKDSDIQWIKTLIKKHVDTTPKLKDFENQVQAEFYREYDNFRLVDDILYRVKQDISSFTKTYLHIRTKRNINFQNF